MSSVASSDSKASDAASTTASTKSVASGTSTVASAASGASGASGTSTVASSVNSAADSGTGTAREKSLKELEEWYNKGPKNDPRVSSWLKATPNSSSMLPVTAPNDVTGLVNEICQGVDEFCEGVRLRTGNDGKIVTEASVDLSRKNRGRKLLEVKGVNGEEDYTLEFKWGPASGKISTFTYADSTVNGTSPPPPNTATDTKKIMPSLASFLKLPEPTIPPPPEWFKSYNPKTAKMGPAKEMSMLMSEFPVLERYKDEMLTQEQCYEHDMNDRALMEALKKAKIDARTASNFALIDKSSYYMSQAGKVPSAMASFVLGTVYKELILPEKKDTFEKALREKFERRLSHPELPVTEDGLDTFRWAATLMHEGELKGVDPTTALGRHLLMRQARVDIWNATEVSYNAATDAATKVADWLHINRNDKLGTGPVLEDLMKYAVETLNAGGKLPKDCPPSILDIAKARDEETKAMSKVSCKSTTPSASGYWDGPLPAQVPAHEAQTSGPNTHKSDATTGTKATLSDTLRLRLKRVKESIGHGKVQSFLDQFPQRTAVPAC